ncbi:hypothetical protein MTsN2n4_42350 [Pseudoalteromonas sp. MTN2-4]
MRIVFLLCVLLCTSCATNSSVEIDKPPAELNERQLQCIKEIKIENSSSKEYKEEKEICIKHNTSNTLGAIIQAAVSVAILISLF